MNKLSRLELLKTQCRNLLKKEIDLQTKRRDLEAQIEKLENEIAIEKANGGRK